VVRALQERSLASEIKGDQRFGRVSRTLVPNLLCLPHKHFFSNVQESGDEMFQELLMENVWVPLPYLVLSTEVHLRGQVEKHLLTPFGYVDIRFPGLEDGPRGPDFTYEVTVAGDFGSWRIDEAGPAEFREYLLNFVREVVETNLGGYSVNPSQLKIHLIDGDLDMVSPGGAASAAVSA
jgi:hypothetical protein